MLIGILGDLWTFHLTLMGISLSIFTLLYSFLLSKKGELLAISEQMKSGANDPLLAQKESLAGKYIHRLVSTNTHCLVVCICSIILGLSSWLYMRFDLLGLRCWVLYIVFIITILEILYLAIIAYKIRNEYLKDIQV